MDTSFQDNRGYSDLSNYNSQDLESGLNGFTPESFHHTFDNAVENNSYEMSYPNPDQDSELQKYLNLTPMTNLDFSSIQNIKNSPIQNSVNKSLKNMMSTPYHNNNFDTSIQTSFPSPVQNNKFTSPPLRNVEYTINQNLNTPIPNKKTYSNSNSYKSSANQNNMYINESYGHSPVAFQDTIPYSQFTNNNNNNNGNTNQPNESNPTSVSYQNSAPFVQYMNNSEPKKCSNKYHNEQMYSNVNRNNHQKYRANNIPCQPQQQHIPCKPQQQHIPCQPQQQHIPCQPQQQHIPCQPQQQHQQHHYNCNNVFKSNKPYIHKVGRPFVIHEHCYNNPFNKLGPKAFPFYPQTTPNFFNANLNLKNLPFYFGFSNMNRFGNFGLMNNFNNFGMAGRVNNMNCFGFNGLNNFLKPSFNNNIFAF